MPISLSPSSDPVSRVLEHIAETGEIYTEEGDDLSNDWPGLDDAIDLGLVYVTSDGGGGWGAGVVFKLTYLGRERVGLPPTLGRKIILALAKAMPFGQP